MSNKQAAPTTAPRPLTLVERIDNIEKALPRINEIGLQRTNVIAKQFGDALGNVVEIVQAVIRLQGDGFDQRIEEEVMAGRRRRAEAELAQAKAVLENLVQNKLMIPSETVVDQCLLVGRDFNTKDEIVGVGRVQVEFGQLPDFLKVDLLGKSPGHKFTNEQGSFIVDEIYIQNPNPPAPEVKEAEAVEAPATESEKQPE